MDPSPLTFCFIFFFRRLWMETIDPSFDTTTLCTLCVLLLLYKAKKKKKKGLFFFVNFSWLYVCLSLFSRCQTPTVPFYWNGYIAHFCLVASWPLSHPLAMAETIRLHSLQECDVLTNGASRISLTCSVTSCSFFFFSFFNSNRIGSLLSLSYLFVVH